jgi:hypothetical protein
MSCVLCELCTVQNELVLWQHVLCIVWVVYCSEWVGVVAACLVYCVSCVLFRMSWCCGSMSCVLCEFCTVQNELVLWQHVLCIVWVVSVQNDCSELTHFNQNSWFLTSEEGTDMLSRNVRNSVPFITSQLREYFREWYIIPVQFVKAYRWEELYGSTYSLPLH